MRRPAGRAGARRAGVTALALFVVTAALAVLLAVLFHLAWPSVLVSVVGTVPALYLAWLAVPGAIGQKKPIYGRRAAQWTPVELGVHQVIGGGPMSAYIRRPHDELLRAVLDPAVPASRLVVVRGGSSTGKTRAAYEAVAGGLSDWQVDYPLDAGALTARLEAGIPARTVLWLGELRQYADADGDTAVLGSLADLLQGDGRLVITTMWAEQWNAYVAAARPGLKTGPADPAGTAGRLLERLPELTGSDPAGIDPARGGVIDVPPRFTAAEMATAARTGDPVLAVAAGAAASAGQDGQVTQYLAGVPDLLHRYAGPGGDPYGQAIITAAMDATRLGHADPLPAALLQDAAVGYLTGPQRTKDIESWRDAAVAWATDELNGAVRVLQPVPPAAGTGVAGYQVADYLDQYGRRTRQDQLGPPSLWDALTAHTAAASDLTRLAQAARDRGLYRHATALWTTAATLGSTDAAGQLVRHLRQVSPADTTRAGQWAADHASLDNPWNAALLLRALREAGAGDAAGTLATRAAGHARLDDPGAVALLLKALREAGADDAVAALLPRDPAGHARLDDPGAVALLLEGLREAGDSDAARTLATRAAGHARLDAPWAVARLLRELREAGDSDAVTALLARDPAGHARLDDPEGAARLLWELREAGDSDAVAALLARDPVGHARLDDRGAVALLLRALREVGDSDAARTLAIRAFGHARLDDPLAVAYLVLREPREVGDAVAALLARDPAGYARLDDPRAVALLLEPLREAGARDAVAALLARDPAGHARLDDPGAVALLLEALREAGDSDAVAALLARDPAGHARLDDPEGAARLLRALREAGDSDAARTLATRAAGHARLDAPWAVARLLRELREAGDSDAVAALLARDPAGHARLDDPEGAAWLLRALREVGARDAVTALLARDPAGHARLDAPWAVARLLEALRAARADDAARTLATRAADAGMFNLFLKVYPDEAPATCPDASQTGLRRNPGNGKSRPGPRSPNKTVGWWKPSGGDQRSRDLQDELT